MIVFPKILKIYLIVFPKILKIYNIFLNLRQLEQKDLLESILCLFVLDTDHLEELKDIIRKSTNNFRDIKGFMYSRGIDDYEGSI